MSNLFQKIGRTIFFLYIISVSLALPYFNWRYAKEHGFMGWLCLGEFVATAKSLVWPYYAIVGFGEKESDVEHFTNSKRAAKEAITILNSFDQGRLPDNEKLNVLRLLEEAVTEAELVGDSYLQIHPEYPRRYKEDYIGSLRQFAEGIQSGNIEKQESAAVKYNIFSDWVSSHKEEFSQ